MSVCCVFVRPKMMQVGQQSEEEEEEEVWLLDDKGEDVRVQFTRRLVFLAMYQVGGSSMLMFVPYLEEGFWREAVSWGTYMSITGIVVTVLLQVLIFEVLFVQTFVKDLSKDSAYLEWFMLGLWTISSSIAVLGLLVTAFDFEFQDRFLLLGLSLNYVVAYLVLFVLTWVVDIKLFSKKRAFFAVFVPILASIPILMHLTSSKRWNALSGSVLALIVLCSKLRGIQVLLTSDPRALREANIAYVLMVLLMMPVIRPLKYDDLR